MLYVAIIHFNRVARVLSGSPLLHACERGGYALRCQAFFPCRYETFQSRPTDNSNAVKGSVQEFPDLFRPYVTATSGRTYSD
jgi:hypothetical protein